MVNIMTVCNSLSTEFRCLSNSFADFNLSAC